MRCDLSRDSDRHKRCGLADIKKKIESGVLLGLFIPVCLSAVPVGLPTTLSSSLSLGATIVVILMKQGRYVTVSLLIVVIAEDEAVTL